MHNIRRWGLYYSDINQENRNIRHKQYIKRILFLCDNDVQIFLYSSMM